MTPDPSSFYRVNEELAHELERLEQAGHLERLLELLDAADVELFVSAARPREGLEELIGVLRPRSATPPGPRPLPQAPEASEGCAGPPSAAHVGALRRAAARGGWDHAGVLAARSRFKVELPDGPREVYMPDHVCPRCFHDEDNTLESCARRCAVCGFAW
ncbi:MAG: hypothetical protein R3F62_08955 [Planctomycetota bacterium]